MRVSGTRGRLAAQRIRLAHEFLGQEFQLAARALAGRQQAPRLVDMGREPVQLLPHVGARGEQRDLLRQAFLRHPRRGAALAQQRRQLLQEALALRLGLAGGLAAPRRRAARRSRRAARPGSPRASRPPRARDCDQARQAPRRRLAASARAPRPPPRLVGLRGLGAQHAGQGQQRLGARRRARRGCARRGRGPAPAPVPAPPGRAARRAPRSSRCSVRRGRRRCRASAACPRLRAGPAPAHRGPAAGAAAGRAPGR